VLLRHKGLLTLAAWPRKAEPQLTEVSADTLAQKATRRQLAEGFWT
jgi:hypothetical protein